MVPTDWLHENPKGVLKKSPYVLRDYQSEAVCRTLDYFRKKRDPSLIVLPTGSGKSLVIAELARRARGRVLVLAHVKELVEQNHGKYESYGLKAGVYAAGLNKKEFAYKVIFASIQSVARASEDFFQDFTLLIIDECHRVQMDTDSQYSQVIGKLRECNEKICILGLTATPYRLGLGWIYNYNSTGFVCTEETRFFKSCIFELPLHKMIKEQYLTPPVTVDIPVTCYDFSQVMDFSETPIPPSYSLEEVERTLKKQRHLTPLIVRNIIDVAEKYDRQGVMIFASTVDHAREILEHLPQGQAHLILGETEGQRRDEIISDFKSKQFKYLVNVSVLTTGFDAPHVDVIAILRPTESVSLYQQIIGRGLRLSESKKDCFILDYAGMGYDIYSPQIRDRKVHPNSTQVEVSCPQCGFVNSFWGQLNEQGELVQHYGRKCRGGGRIQRP